MSDFMRWFRGKPFDEDAIPKLSEVEYATVREICRQAFEAGQSSENLFCRNMVFESSKGNHELLKTLCERQRDRQES